jgi:hypothetical protein
MKRVIYVVISFATKLITVAFLTAITRTRIVAFWLESRARAVLI